MDDGQAEFRRETRRWLEANCPASLRVLPTPPEEEIWGGSQQVFSKPDAKLWLERMAERGWTAPRVPREYGGGGLTQGQARILDEEMSALSCRQPLWSIGLLMLAPTLLELGSEEQKRQHIPPMLRGELRWCQGYSEPGAGSDLASLQTRAVLEGDTYVVNGQKVWTSHAEKADWMFCLVRTDPTAPKHAGISFLLIDMRSPGVRVRPILLLSGSSPFCETFFEDVRVPARNLVGEPNRGWSIGKRLLQFERGSIANLRASKQPQQDEPLDAIAKRCLGVTGERIAEPLLRDRIVRLEMDEYCYTTTLRRSADAVSAGLGAGAETSMFKYYGTEMGKRRKELRVELQGSRGLGWQDEAFTTAEQTATREFLRSRANSIEGGSSEIQLNIIAKQVLGLPD